MASWRDMAAVLGGGRGGPLSEQLRGRTAGALWDALNEGAFGQMNRGLGAVMEDDAAWRAEHPAQAQAMDAIDLITMGGPTAALGIYAGPKALTADLGMLAKAKSLVKSGVHPDDVRAQTKWFEGPDGKWRFEIDDSGYVFDRAALKKKWDMGGRASDAVKHDELFDAYPDLRESHMTIDGYSRGGSYSNAKLENVGAGGAISGGKDYRFITIGDFADDTVPLHEFQHAVQEIEGFELGSNPRLASLEFPHRFNEHYRHRLYKLGSGATEIDKAMALEAARKDTYLDMFGEVEARNVQARSALTADERVATSPYRGDVSERWWLFRGSK